MRRRKEPRGNNPNNDPTDSAVCTTEDSACDERDDHPPLKRGIVAEKHENKVGFIGKVKKAAWRSLFGTLMMGAFGFIISCGHAYVCILVFVLQCFLFGELVGVRKKMAAERKLPLFRSIQWAWFFTAAFWTWSDGMFAFLRESPLRVKQVSEEFIGHVLQRSALISFWLYSALLVASILSLRKGLYRYQLTQYSWTLVTCSIVVFQMRAVFQTIYSGLFWFVLPCSLVICNDIMAYFCGVTFGKVFISAPFLELSPNKTWEGFIGSVFFTLIFAFFFSGFLAGLPLMVCVPEKITLEFGHPSCTPNKLFLPQPLAVYAEDNTQLSVTAFRWFLGVIIAYIPRLRDMQVCVAQFHALGLGTFASFVAPFGGFLASAIKRAYGVKDFAHVIPGHGGLMDRFDCQFVMAMCTYVHIMTFCRDEAAATIDGLLAAVQQLSPEERAKFMTRLSGNSSYAFESGAA